MTKRPPKRTCDDLIWLNRTCHVHSKLLLDHVAKCTAEDPQTVATSVGSNLIYQATAMICVGSGVRELSVPLAQELLDLVMERLQEREQQADLDRLRRLAGGDA